VGAGLGHLAAPLCRISTPDAHNPEPGNHPMPDKPDRSEGPPEILLVGDLTENEHDVSEKLLSVEPGGECVLYFNSLGGSPYSAISLTSLVVLRDLRATGVVLGECSPAALWPFAACRRRLVTRYSVLLFHPMKWQSEENVGISEAAEWARHFGQLESDMDAWLAELLGGPVETIRGWIKSSRYVTGRELAEAGLAEPVELRALGLLRGR